MTDRQAQTIKVTNPPELAPAPGYSQVVEVRAGRLVFIAGQTALARDGNLVGRGDFAAQADQVFGNLAAALASARCTARDLVKLTVFVRDMSKLAVYRQARDRFFATTTPPAAPAITLVEVSRLFADDFLIEIEAVAATEAMLPCRPARTHGQGKPRQSGVDQLRHNRKAAPVYSRSRSLRS